MRVYEVIAGSTSLDGLRRSARPDPVVQSNQILVKVQAASLNFRDLMIVRGRYFGGALSVNTVPLSDGAGEVVAVGTEVSRFHTGDRVCGTFFRGWLDGRPPARPLPALGAPPADGMLAELVTMDEQHAVAVPAHLSLEAAATLPCAAVTAWHGLIENGRLMPGETVLLIGTGGVSVFALQFARLGGARAIVISSNDDKLERARSLGAEAGINYHKTPDWDAEVLRLTQGRGVDHVIEVGGAGTLGRSMNAAATGGRIQLIGVLTGGGVEPPSPYGLLAKQASIQGVFVGSRGHFERMNAAIGAAKLEPVIDRVFSFEDAAAAYRHLDHGAHFGKIVIRL
jgi:NADPH:quinone reductase-like Zn-dependent oxidoreductase